MKTVFFYILYNQIFSGVWYEKPPQKAIISGLLVVEPCKAPKRPKTENIGIGDTIFVTPNFYGKISEIKPNCKRCKSF